MTATDELRRLLDERGVEYRIREGKDGFRRFTYWQGTAGNGYPFYARYEQEHYAEGDMTVLEINMHKYQLTPAEAIEATLGKGECEVVKGTGHGPTAGTKSSCSECGGVMNARDRYCRWCGRKVRA